MLSFNGISIWYRTAPLASVLCPSLQPLLSAARAEGRLPRRCLPSPQVGWLLPPTVCGDLGWAEVAPTGRRPRGAWFWVAGVFAAAFWVKVQLQPQQQQQQQQSSTSCGMGSFLHQSADPFLQQSRPLRLFFCCAGRILSPAAFPLGSRRVVFLELRTGGKERERHCRPCLLDCLWLHASPLLVSPPFAASTTLFCQTMAFGLLFGSLSSRGTTTVFTEWAGGLHCVCLHWLMSGCALGVCGRAPLPPPLCPF